MFYSFSKKQALLILSSIFITTQAIGLFVANQYIQFIKAGELSPVFGNPGSMANAFILFAYMMIMTAVIILIIRYRKKLLTVFEAIAIFFASAITFDFLFPYFIGLGELLAFVLVVLKITKPNRITQNTAMVFSIAGAGAVIGVSFTVLPLILFILLLACYDFVSVFITKHMVYMAKNIADKPTAFTAAVPCKEINHTFQLGGGDVAIPLMFASSVLANHGLIPAIASVIGALTALVLLFKFIEKNPGKPLPALPAVGAGALLFFMITMILL